MRKVTASAVILTALTGCGQNSGIPSTQWSFEIPAEDEISSLALDQEVDSAAATLVSTADGSYSQQDTFVDKSFGSSTGDFMGPAFEQPGVVIETDVADTSTATGLRSINSEALSLSNSYRSFPTTEISSGYQPVAARPDPIAQVKAFLSAHGSPSALNGLNDYHSSVVTPVLPTVYLPPAPVDTTASLGIPTDIDAQASSSSSASFTGAGLPIVESSGGGVYRNENSSSANGLLAIAPAQEQPIYQPVAAYSSLTELVTPLSAGPSNSAVSSTISSAEQRQSPSIGEDGLPLLEASRAGEASIGTAILQGLQAEADVQTASTVELAQDLYAQAAVGDRLGNAEISNAGIDNAETNIAKIDIAIVPAEADAPYRDLTADVSQVSSSGLTEVAATDVPTLEGLQRRSAQVQEVSPLVTYTSSSADNSDLAVEEIAVTAPQPTFPTLKRLLETMPETSAQSNLAVDLPLDNNTASPLLEGLRNVEPLSTLYLPIPETVSEEAVASTSADLVKASLTSLSKGVAVVRTRRDAFAETVGASANKVTNLRQGRNKAILSLVDKPIAKKRQLVTY